MAQDDASAICRAVTAWHEKLVAHPATKGVLLHEQGTLARPAERREAVAIATEHLATCLEDNQLPDGLIDDMLSVCETFAALCGVDLPTYAPGSSSVGGVRPGGLPPHLNPTKLKILKAASGLPVHTTSIGRRASASYCVYESMGGWETLSAAVESLYNRMRNDTRCGSLFRESNEQSLKTHMLEFLTCALGGKARFASSTLLTTQLRSYGFGAGQFEVMLKHMKAVLDELGVQQEVAASAVSLLRCHKHLFEKQAPESPDEDPAPAEC